MKVKDEVKGREWDFRLGSVRGSGGCERRVGGENDVVLGGRGAVVGFRGGGGRCRGVVLF